ncbi:rhamnogalacturonan lyase family protein [Marinoscillum furvescens]|uniref:Rhamnogalacturonan endolyase n=1 Tax=Marinoscillum furvescens DSM 4134 TaxID=1122208 RepID=A0A3D9LHL3_MARFU|nr:T9SS type A sorting domain-containing protein [Marinoscillum furvescens]REE05499.1 rhamnogalacturonan endolyase [Marinoscillum furvescens DSM 4134]
MKNYRVSSINAKSIGLLMGIVLILINHVQAQTDVAHIKRSVVAIKSAEGVYVNWSLKSSDSEEVGFDVYRFTDGGTGVKLNETPILSSTNFFDSTTTTSGNQYAVVPVLNGTEQESSDTVAVLDEQYLNIPLQIPAGGNVLPDGNTYDYRANDASVADLDGDGTYEIILKWDPTRSRDNSQGGYTGKTLIDAYKLDGTLLWRIDLGYNCRSGAHYNQFMVYDVDGDGKAEMYCKTAPGTKDGTGNYLSSGPAANDDDHADYRNNSGYVLEGPEYLTVFNGTDGKELASVNLQPARGNVGDWGDTYGNRVDRFLGAIAYLDGQSPSIVWCRGIYEKTQLAAYDWDGVNLSQKWLFNADDNENSEYAGMGSHNLSVADIDSDGFDEIMYGSCAIDHDGTGLWSKQSEFGKGSADAGHLTDIMPDREGLEKFGIMEGTGNPGAFLLDARTGETLWKTGNKDVGRGVAGDLVPEFYGMECWGGTDGLRSANNQRVGSSPGSVNFVTWWDGDLSRETMSNISVRKYTVAAGGETVIFEATGCVSNNSTKATPALQADILGDWREEIIWRTEDNSALRIYTTTIPSDYRFVRLMEDHVYRLSVAWQNNSYNQPPHTGFYLGSDMFKTAAEIPPSPPTELELTLDTAYVQLNWKANYESDIQGYHIYKSSGSENNFQLLTDTVTGNEFKDYAIELDVEYFYYILSEDTSANTSAASQVVSGIPTDRPDVPDNVNVRAGKSKSLIYWDASSAEMTKGYNVYFTETSGSGYVKLNTELITDTTYLHEGLSESLTYYYIVRAMGFKESLDSEEVFVVPGNYKTIQAETGLVVNGYIENNHVGFEGEGFVNLSSAGYLQLPYIYSEQEGWTYLAIRYANGSGEGRTGKLHINDSSFSYTMESTGQWNNYIYDTLLLNLNAGFQNFLTIESTGNDFGNIDEVIVSSEQVNPEDFDCMGVYLGTAYLDDCGVCVSGSSGFDPCYSDITEGVTYRISLDHSGLCVEGGEEIIQNECAGVVSQNWLFEKGFVGYKIKNSETDLYMGYVGNTVTVSTAGREWRVEQTENGKFRIVKASDLEIGIAIPGKKTDEGVGLSLVPRTNGASAHLFGIEESLALGSDNHIERLVAYPNPFIDQVHISVNYSGDFLPEIEVISMLGQQVVSDQMQPTSGSEFIYDWKPKTEISKGIYLANIRVNDEIIAVYRLLYE